MNSKVLVGVQFLAIGIIMIPKASIMITPFWWVLVLLASLLGLWIFMHNRVGNFNIVPEIRDNATLIMTGPYRFVRHPMYSVLILFMLGIVLWHFNGVNGLSLLIMIGAVLLKAFKEEALWSHHDSAYQEYQQKSKMLIPFIL